MAHADEHHRPGEPPEIRDEAADTPMWVPAMGLALLLCGAIFLVWQSATAEEAAAAEQAEQAEQAAPAEEEAREAPAEADEAPVEGDGE